MDTAYSTCLELSIRYRIILCKVTSSESMHELKYALVRRDVHVPLIFSFLDVELEYSISFQVES